MDYSNKLIIFLKIIIFILIFFGLWNSLIVGASYDEPFHAADGMRRLRYLISFGEYQNYQYANNQFYPGLYDTISSSISHVIYKFYPNFFMTVNVHAITFFHHFFIRFHIISIKLFFRNHSTKSAS